MNRSSIKTLVLCVAVGAPLGAQVSGVVSPQTSAVHIQLVNPTQAQLDTVRALMRQLEQLAPGTPAHEAVLRQIDGLMPATGVNRVIVRGSSTMPSGVVAARVPLPKGWIGLNVQGMHTELLGPDGFLVEYLDRPSVTSVDPESPAQRAGIEPGDMLMAYNGTDVLGTRFDLTDLLVPDKKISVTVKRDGDTRVYDMTVAKVPQGVTLRRRDLGTTTAVGDIYFKSMNGDGMPPVPMSAIPRATIAGSMILVNKGVLITPNGAMGAVMSTVSPELAKMLKLETGVLVNDITDDTPAAKAGLHPGDVVVNVGGQPVASLRALQEQLLRRTDPSSVVLQVFRDKKLRKITVNW